MTTLAADAAALQALKVLSEAQLKALRELAETALKTKK